MRWGTLDGVGGLPNSVASPIKPLRVYIIRLIYRVHRAKVRLFRVSLVPRDKKELPQLLISSKHKMHITDDFAQNFQALLKQACLSQLEVAAISGIHKQSINRYATGKTVPNWTELLKLADALNCSLDSFRTGMHTTPKISLSPEPDPRVEEMKPIVKELGSVVNRLASIVSR